MAQELYYTSARKGLKLGTRGFCTVAHTLGMHPGIVRLLESLSAYKTVYGGHDSDAGKNPVSISHFRAVVRHDPVSILSRVGPAGMDHTNRDNKFAHHIVLDKGERVAGGPAWLAGAGIFAERWEGLPRLIPAPLKLPSGDVDGLLAATWGERFGDPGWAGFIANSFETQPNRAIYFVFEPGMDVLPLIAEALAVLPVIKRWLVTFSTYFTQLPAGVSCNWRCCLPSLPQLKEARATASALVLDLSKPLGSPTESHLVKVARGEAKPLPPRRRKPQVERVDEPQETGFVTLSNRHREKLTLRPEARKVGGDL